MEKNKQKNVAVILWIVAGILALALMFARAAAPDLIWLTAVLCVGLVAALGGLIYENRKSLTVRTAAYGFNSAITAILVIAIVGVLNFLADRHPLKLDLTKVDGTWKTDNLEFVG